MAVIKKTKLPVSKVTGPVGGTDKSKGKEKGISANLWYKYPNGIYVAPAAHKKKPSAAQLLQRSRYCDCDLKWKLYTVSKRDQFRFWWIWTNGHKTSSLPTYQLYMSACCANRFELNWYPDYCWAGIYSYTNTFPFVIAARDIYLMDVPFLNPAGTDNVVFYYSVKNVVYGSVPRVVVAPGILKIESPVMQVGQTFRWMVYSYMGV